MRIKKFSVKVTYDFEADAFYFKLKKGKSVKQLHFQVECIADFDESGDLSGIKMLDVTDAIHFSQPKFQKMLKKALKEKGGMEYKEFFKKLEKESGEK